jgi:hypothetical protein
MLSLEVFSMLLDVSQRSFMRKLGGCGTRDELKILRVTQVREKLGVFGPPQAAQTPPPPLPA